MFSQQSRTNSTQSPASFSPQPAQYVRPRAAFPCYPGPPEPPSCLLFPFLAKPLCSADGMRQRLLESSFYPVPGVRMCHWAWLACALQGRGETEPGGRGQRRGPCLLANKKGPRCGSTGDPEPTAPAQALLGAAVPPFPTPDLLPIRDRTSTLFVP